jgi:hypothetical protein
MNIRYIENNRETVKESRRKYASNNKEALCVNAMRRIARKKNLTPKHASDQWIKIYYFVSSEMSVIM